MSIISKKRKRESGRTTFYLESTGKPIGYVDTELSADDWSQIHALCETVYDSGLRDGSAARAEEICVALGITTEKADGNCKS